MPSNNPPPPAYPGSDTEGSSADEEYRQSLRAPGVDLTRVRSAQDEERPLPDGWIRQYDASSQHHFYVDTTAEPPRSIWVHPFDDPEFIRSIPDTERDAHTSSDLPSSATAQRGHDQSSQPRDPRAYAPGGIEQQQQQSSHKDEKRSLGDKIKEGLTGKTKEERAARRREKAAAERAEQKRLEQAYLARREALRQHMNDPRFAQRYQSPAMAYNRGPYMGGGYGMGGRYGGYGGGYGGYGGYGRRGMGMGMPLMGGLGGGLLLGSMMGGGMGGGFGGDCGGGGGDGGGGGEPKLNILQHKSYHPYLEKNKERVRKDEEKERLRVEAEEQRSLQADADARLALLRGQAPPQVVASSSSSTAASLPEDPFYAAQPEGERRADRKGKSRAKQDDMRALDRLLLSGGRSSGKGRQDEEGGSSAAPEPRPTGDESLSFYGKDGHLNFWASEEMRPPHNIPDKQVKKTPEELERDDPYTMYLTRPERELKPWYTDPQLRKVEDRQGRDKVLDRKREQRIRKDEESKLKRDPYTQIQSHFSSRVRSSTSSSRSATQPLPPDATPTDKRLLRESSERERALALVARHRLSSAASPSSEPSTPAVSLRSATPSSVRSGGWSEGGAYGGSTGYGESRFHPDALRRVERERDRRRDRR